MKLRQLVILTEEESMREFLLQFLPRFAEYFMDKVKINNSESNHAFRFEHGIDFQVISHNGKSDLTASLPRKLKAWQTPAQFLVLHDKDSNDCKKLKNKLLKLNTTKRDLIVRIVCTELESWYLGCIGQCAEVYKKEGKYSQIRNADSKANAIEEFKKYFPEYQKLKGSSDIGAGVDVEKFVKNNTSSSFAVFLKSIEKFLNRIVI